jgi:phage-related protein
MNRAQKQLNGFQKGINKVMKGIGFALGGLAIGKLVKDSLSAASELESAFVGLESILTGQGRSFSKAKAFINDYIQDGLIPLTDAITAYKNLAARGYNDEQIQQVMERLKDAAAFGRQSSYTLGEAVRTATEGLKNENSILVDNAGVTKNVSKMWDDYAKSIGKTRNQLTQAEKIQAEVNGIIQETQWQVGDAAKYADTYAGRLAALGKTLRDIKINLGNAFMPIVNTVLPVLQTLFNWLSRVTAAFAAFSQALFGKAPQVQAKATQAQAQAMEELGDATEKAGKQAKGAVASFDEVHQLDLEGGAAADITSGGGIVAADTTEIEETAGVFGTVSEKAEEMAARVRTAFNNLKNAIVENKNIILPALGAIAGALTGIAIYTGINNLIGAFKTLQSTAKLAWAALLKNPILLVVAAIGALIGALITAYLTNDEFREKVDQLWARLKSALVPVIQAVGEVLKWVWNNVMVPAGQFIAGVFVAAWEAVSSAAKWLWQNILVPFGDFLKWLWNSVLVPVGRILIDVLAVAFSTVAGIAKSFWENVLVPLGNALAEMFGPAVEAVSAVLSFLWNDVFVPLAEFLISIFKPIIEALIEVFEFLWQNVFKPLAEFVGSVFVAVFDNMFKSIGDIIEGLKNIFIGLMDFITGIFTGDWERAWEGVKKIFKGVFDSLWGIVKFPLNLIIDGINWVIGGLNRLKIKIPDWVRYVPGLSDLAGKTWGINIKEIPKLAKGGLVTAPTLAMLGEAGPEAVVPLGRSGFAGDLADTVAQAVYQAIMDAIRIAQASSQQSDDRELVLKIDNTVLARMQLPAIIREGQRQGLDLVVRPQGV